MVKNRAAYATSFFGIVDLLAIVPTYLSLFLPGAQSLLVIRTFRLLRIFRVFKLATYLGEANVLYTALKNAKAKITVFLTAVGATVITTGALMRLIEGPENGFTNIPKSIYWAIVTMTTMGFGDITPNTPLGQFVASLLMILGYGVIAVPTENVTTEIARSSRVPILDKLCPHCKASGHLSDAIFCRRCGKSL